MKPSKAPAIKRLLHNEYLWVFLFCLAAVHGAAFSLMDNFDVTACTDCKTYIGLAQLDLNQSPIRRYRPIVPLLAGLVHAVLGKALGIMKPTNFAGDFGLSFSFYLVNSILISLWGLVIYRLGRAYGLQRVWALCGTLVMLTCRWTPYIAGTPVADSVYCLVIGMALLGMRLRHTGLTLAAIFLGPFAKEAFIFIAPIIFFYSHLPKLRLVVFFALSGLLVFGFRYAYDTVAGLPPGSGLAADADHINYIADNTRRLLSFHGAYDVLSNMGLWLLMPMAAAAIAPAYRAQLRPLFTGANGWLWLSILLHMVLSSSFERMFYLGMPLLCVATGMAMYQLYLASGIAANDEAA